MEDGARVLGQGISQGIDQVGDSIRGARAPGIQRLTRTRVTSGARRSRRQRIEAPGERDTTIAQALRRLDREHMALLLAICELEGPTSPAVGAFGERPSPAMREALLVLLRDDLGRTQQALSLAAEGRYGACEDCQRPIARRELELNPATTHCAVCQTRQ